MNQMLVVGHLSIEMLFLYVIIQLSGDAIDREMMNKLTIVTNSTQEMNEFHQRSSIQAILELL